MTYDVEIPQPRPNHLKWCTHKAHLTLDQAITCMDKFPCARVVREDGLVVARITASTDSRWILTHYNGSAIK